jgi:hypothetical protein
MSSAAARGEVGAEGVVGLAGDVALEAADDFAAVEAFASASFGVGAGAGVVAEAADGDHVEGAVGLAVAAVVKPVTLRAAAAGWNRGGGTELGEGGFTAEALDVLARGHEQLAGALSADAEERDSTRRGGRDKARGIDPEGSCQQAPDAPSDAVLS